MPTWMLLIGISIALLRPVSAGETFCADAPLPRLSIGGQGEVAPGVDRLRLRALPAVGTGEVRLLYTGASFHVLAGPSCNGGYAWWRVELEDGTTGWLAEGTWETYYVRPVSDVPRPLCERAETPWLHLLLTFTCRLLSGPLAVSFQLLVLRQVSIWNMPLPPIEIDGKPLKSLRDSENPARDLDTCRVIDCPAARNQETYQTGIS